MELSRVIKKDFKELSMAWKVWLLVGLSSVLFVSFYSFSGLTIQFIIGLFAGLSGVAYVTYTAHDKKSAMIFGIIMVLLYGIMAFINGVYGDAMQNLLYQLPVLIFGFVYYDSKKASNFTGGFLQKIISQKKWLVVLWIIIFIVYSFILVLLGDISPVADSFTTVTSMFGVILLAMRNKYQWYLWIAVNSVSMFIWYSISGLSVMFIMWSFYLINSFVGFYFNVIKNK